MESPTLRSLPFFHNAEINPRPTAGQKSLDDSRVAETNSQLEAGHPRLRDNQPRRSHTIFVPDADVVFQESHGREILAEDLPKETLVPATPCARLARCSARVRIHGFIAAAVNRPVRLGISCQVDSAQHPVARPPAP